MTEQEPDVSEETLAQGERIVSGERAALIYSALESGELEACPLHGHHVLTLDELAPFIPAGQSTKHVSVRTRLHAQGFRVTHGYDAESVLPYFRNTPAQGWRKGKKGGW